MKASETQLFKLLGGQQHFMVPLFQRTYTWDKNDWETLWNDLLETHQMGSNERHFLGPLVTKSLPATPEGVSPFLVIDGQQRLTTVTILLAALRDVIRDQDPTIAEKIHDLYLRNKYTSDLTRYKVLPTQGDREAYFAIVDGQSENGASSRMRVAYSFFRTRLKQLNGSETGIENINVKQLEKVILTGLELVSITLGEDDNEYRIFESLNGKGTPLSQADLLRNYFFMRIPIQDHDTAYNDLWLPMQSSLGSALEEFFRYEFMSYGMSVRQGDVYQAWKKRLERKSSVQVMEELSVLVEHSRAYRRLIDPDTEPNPLLRRSFHRLKRWVAQTVYPFLLYVYRLYESGGVEVCGFVEVLQIIESFLVRRLFAGVPTNTLNRIFLRLSDQLPQGLNLMEGTRAVLSEPSRRWPTDAQFKDGILRYPLYTDSGHDQPRLILESLEESFQHKEHVIRSNLTIEHIMPQKLTSEWREELGTNTEEIHKRLLHVLGNLTLTGYNPELSNATFKRKRAVLQASNLEMNKEIAMESEWTAQQIEERGQRLAERAIQIWPGPKQ